MLLVVRHWEKTSENKSLKKGGLRKRGTDPLAPIKGPKGPRSKGPGTKGPGPKAKAKGPGSSEAQERPSAHGTEADIYIYIYTGKPYVQPPRARICLMGLLWRNIIGILLS